MRVKFSRQFDKTYTKASLKIKTAFENKLRVFIKDPFNTQLNNHPLKGKYSGYRSINITGDWRAIFIEQEDNSDKIVTFEIIGTHSQLYK